MTNTIARAALLAMCVLLGGCASGDTDARQQAETHTMPDGSVMEGPTHVHDDSHAHGEDGAGGQDVGPSDAARMVCSGQVVDDVTRILGADAAVEPASTWQKPVFTCSFDLPEGPLVLSVHDGTGGTGGEPTAHFEAMRASHADAKPIKGVYSLGLPAYETPAGTVAFVKDGRTLEVDATGLSGKLGAEGDLDRAGVAYAVATSVLACWTEHT